MLDIVLRRRVAAIAVLACFCLAACGGPKRPSEQEVTDVIKQHLPDGVTLDSITTQYTALKVYEGTTMPDGSWSIEVGVSAKAAEAFVSSPDQALAYDTAGKSPWWPFARLHHKTEEDGKADSPAFRQAGARSGLDYRPWHSDGFGYGSGSQIVLPPIVIAVAPAGKIFKAKPTIIATPDKTAAGGWHYDVYGMHLDVPFLAEPIGKVQKDNPGKPVVVVGSPEFAALQAKIQALDTQFVALAQSMKRAR